MVFIILGLQLTNDTKNESPSPNSVDIEKGDRVNGTALHKSNDTNNNRNHHRIDSTSSTELSHSKSDENNTFSCNVHHTNEIETHTHIPNDQSTLKSSAEITESIRNLKNHRPSTQSKGNEQQLNHLTQTTVIAAPPFYQNDYTDKQQKLSSKAVDLLRRSKWLAVVLISCLLAVSVAITICTKMGWDYTIPAILVGVVAIIASSGLWYWLYIAAITAPRDIRWVLIFYLPIFAHLALRLRNTQVRAERFPRSGPRNRVKRIDFTLNAKLIQLNEFVN